MISSFRNFAKTKFAGLLVFIMIIPFVFWGMGSMFNTGNTNTIAKINKINISTQEFLDYLNDSGIQQKTIRSNLDNNIIEEILSNLVSTKILELEVKDYELKISKKTLLKKIKNNKNFLDQDGNFQRMMYEKFLLENNQSAPNFELKLMGRELQKNLFDYIGSGTVSPKFFIKKLYEEQNKKLEIDFINLEKFYKKKNSFTNKEIDSFLNVNEDKLRVEYLNFSYVILNPKNLIGVNKFNQSFFEKIDKIEVDLANGVNFEDIIGNLNLVSINKSNYKFSSNDNEIEKKIFELRNNNFDIFEMGDDYILYQINEIDQRTPDMADVQTKNEILELMSQKNKFEYNSELLKKIRNGKFNDNAFQEYGKDNIENITLNSPRDNKKFEINGIEILYTLPENSFTLINDEQNNIYLTKIKKYKNIRSDIKKDELNDFEIKQNTKTKNSMLKSYDLYLNDKYNVILNEKTIERVKNFFQ
tara:strand:- start:1973 stop:3391 length:1419 start_codon:yes stop_codon:yes gene_type:complete